MADADHDGQPLVPPDPESDAGDSDSDEVQFDGAELLWSDFEPEPTTIIAYWPHAEPPSQTEIMLAMRSALSAHQLAAAAADAHGGFGDIEVLDELETGGDVSVQWNAVVQVPHLPYEMIVWCEPAQPIPADEPHAALVQPCRWVIGFETMLDPEDPLSSYIELMRLVSETISDAPVVLDANTSVSHERAAVEELFCRPGIEPPADVLWIIHVVALDEPGSTAPPPDDPDDALNESMWLHTHGLRRCGRPELELLAVNTALVDSAAELLNAVSEQLLQYDLPAPGEPIAVGTNITVTVQPWQVAAAHLPDAVPGSVHDRQQLRHQHFAGDVSVHQCTSSEDDDDDADAREQAAPDIETSALHQEDSPDPAENPGASGTGSDDLATEPHCGVSAVVCGPQPIGAHGDIWVYPREALVRIENEEAVVFRTMRSTLRQQRLAQQEWGQFATAMATVRTAGLNGQRQPRFLVKAGFPISEGDIEEREHLWFEVQAIEKDAAHAQLLNEPMYVTTLRKGQSISVAATGISDWVVNTPMGNFGPDQTREMWSAIDELKAATDDG